MYVFFFLTMRATYPANLIPLLRILMALVLNDITVSRTEEDSCVFNKMAIFVQHII
jgi:hypothetical protein